MTNLFYLLMGGFLVAGTAWFVNFVRYVQGKKDFCNVWCALTAILAAGVTAVSVVALECL